MLQLERTPNFQEIHHACVRTAGECGDTNRDAPNAVTVGKLQSRKRVPKQSQSRPHSGIWAGLCQPNAGETNPFVNNKAALCSPKVCLTAWTVRIQLGGKWIGPLQPCHKVQLSCFERDFLQDSGN